MLTAEQVDRHRHGGYLLPFPAVSPDESAERREGPGRFEGWLSERVTEAQYDLGTYRQLDCARSAAGWVHR
jgi:hypothetical protein